MWITLLISVLTHLRVRGELVCDESKTNKGLFCFGLRGFVSFHFFLFFFFLKCMFNICPFFTVIIMLLLFFYFSLYTTPLRIFAASMVLFFPWLLSLFRRCCILFQFVCTFLAFRLFHFKFRSFFSIFLFFLFFFIFLFSMLFNKNKQCGRKWQRER